MIDSSYLFLFKVLVIFGVAKLALHYRQLFDPLHPPIVTLSHDEMFREPLESYERALRKNGPVIAVKRKGIMEIIVGEEFTPQVLTDDTNFSFEQGTAKILNLRFVQKFNSNRLFGNVDSMVTNLVSRHLPTLVENLSPIFEQRARGLKEKEKGEHFDMFSYAHNTVAEAMILMLLGKHFISKDNIETVVATADAVAELTGIYQNQSPFARSFPFIWRALTWVKVVFYRIGFGFFRKMGPSLWAEITRLEHREGKEQDQKTLLALLVDQCISENHVSPGARLWISQLMVAAIFASVHQTVSVSVWVMFELAMRPEYQESIQDEIHSIEQTRVSEGKGPRVDFDYLRRATRLDSFIREVLRLKGDSLGLVRMTTRPIFLGGYRIPKGYLVYPLVSLSNRSKEHHGPTAKKFDGMRWNEQKPAAMVTPGYMVFGQGRWACPGRFLAVSEIKMIVISLLRDRRVELFGGSYTVVDKLNVTSVPPEGVLCLRPVD